MFSLNVVKIKSPNTQLSNEERLISLMEQYGASLNKLAFTYLKDWARSEDVVQEVFMSCYKNLDDFREESAYRTWLYRITVNQCIDIIRKKNLLDYFSIKELKEYFIKKDNSAENEMLKKNDEHDLAKHVMSLPLKYREVVVLFYYEDLSINEISLITNINVQTIKTRLKRAKEQLKKSYERGN